MRHSPFTKRTILKGLFLTGLASAFSLSCHTETETFRYLALGDSYTVGESVSAAESWPSQLSNLLRQEGVGIGTPEILAKTGWTTGELLSAIAERDLHGPYNLVTLLIGVNNQYRGQSVSLFRREFRQLLDLAIGFAGSDPSRVPCRERPSDPWKCGG